jgi:hypothetical protein
MWRDDRETNRYFDVGLLFAALAELGMMAYWSLTQGLAFLSGTNVHFVT